MPLPLSYPGLKCVLEHLEAVKRAHIIARSPGLQKIDKLIPLSLENLCIDNNGMTINKLLIAFVKDGVKLEMNWKTMSRQKSDHRLFPDVLAVDLKLRVNTLYALSRGDFETVHSFIDSQSFPLKTVITIPERSNFDSQIVKSAETLILYLVVDRTLTLEGLKKLNNKKVVLEYCSSSRVDMIALIKYHFETKKVVETSFRISTNIGVINKMLLQFEQAYGGFRCDLDGVNERFIPGSPKFSIPINDNSKIRVYAIEDPEDGPCKIIVKPVAPTSA